MSSTRDIQLSTDVYAAIWAARQPGEHTEDAILRRLLGVPVQASAPNNKSTALRPTLPAAGDDEELREAANKLRLLPTAPKPANTEKPSGQTEGVTSSQRRWDKIADALADPFRLVR
jgi:hypothetical protein